MHVDPVHSQTARPAFERTDMEANTGLWRGPLVQKTMPGYKSSAKLVLNWPTIDWNNK